MSCFAMVYHGKRTVNGCYSCTLRYASLFYDKHFDRSKSEEVMSVSLKEFLAYGVHIRNNVKDIDGKIHRAWTVAVVFNPLNSINDPLYSEGDGTHRLGETQKGDRLMWSVYQKCFFKALRTSNYRI